MGWLAGASRALGHQWPRFEEREHLQILDVICGHEPDEQAVGSPGFGRLHTVPPAKAGTTNQAHKNLPLPVKASVGVFVCEERFRAAL